MAVRWKNKGERNTKIVKERWKEIRKDVFLTRCRKQRRGSPHFASLFAVRRSRQRDLERGKMF